jgi:PAS domain S-box-containing protein
MSVIPELADLCLLRQRAGRVAAVSAAFMRQFGPAGVGREWTEALGLTAPDEARAWLAAADSRAAHYAQAGARWLRLRTYDGGGVLGVEDVTAEREAHERVRLEGDHFHALIERAAEGISLFDPQANILYESPANKRIHGYAQREMEGRNLFDFCHPDDMARVMPRFTRLAQAPGIVETDIVRFRHKAGHWIYLEGTVINATDDPRVGALVNNFRDVTGRLEADRELRRAKDAAEEAQRLQQHFLTNLSHEFKTPLTLIRGPLSDLAEGRIRTEDVPAALTLVLRNVERLDGLISELIDLARLEAGTFALRVNRHDLSAFVRAELDAFTSQAAAKGIKLRLDAPVQCPVFFDAPKLRKVVTNLLANALRFSPEQGTLEVKINAQDGPAPDGRVEVSVRDEGPGMDEDTRRRVFERFFQADTSLARAHEGMGIGLALAREMVEMHGGTVGVQSAPGRGSTFFFTLPLGCEHLDPDDIDTSAAPEPRAHTVGSGAPVMRAADQTAVARHRPRLLLVEDNADMRAYLRTNLDPYYTVAEAVDGQQAWETIGALEPEVILSDVMMPRLDGLELCRRLKADSRWRRVPLLLLSAKGSVDHRVEGLKAGADDYVAKPFSVAELLQRLRSRAPWGVSEDAAGSTWRESLLRCMDEHLGSADFDVAALAGRLGYSERQLQRRVVEHFGLTPSALLLQRRLRRANELLAHRQHETVAEIAHAVGLSPGYFSRRYRRTYGTVGVPVSAAAVAARLGHNRKQA